MKYSLQEISELDDWSLIEAYSNCGQAHSKREEASKHDKFNKDRMVNSKLVKKMEFPPINPQFVQMKNEIEAEMKKRKLI